VNDPTLFTKDYERFLQNRLRQELPFGEIPVRLLYRAREKVKLSFFEDQNQDKNKRISKRNREKK